MWTVTGFCPPERSPQLRASPRRFGRQGEYAGWQSAAVVGAAVVVAIVVVVAMVVGGAVVVVAIVVGGAVVGGTGVDELSISAAVC